jgi:hypothetical protein
VKSFAQQLYGPFPLLKATGLTYLDKVMFDAINQRYEWVYEWKSGFGFNEGFNTNICQVARKLWDIRRDLKHRGSLLQGVIKRMINSLFGKSIQKEKPTYKRDVPKVNLAGKLHRNQGFIFSVKPIKDNDVEMRVRLMTTVGAQYIRPQFGVNVLSYSRVSMQKLIDRAVCLEHPVYYSNTDCLVMTEEGAKQVLEPIKMLGQELGKFADELPQPAEKFICLSARRYIFTFDRGEPKVRFGPKNGDPEEYFERKLLEK